MNIKKITALLLASILLVPTAMHAGEMDKELAALIPVVKQKINVPKEFTEFRSDISSQNKEGKADLYSLSWTDKASEVGQLQVMAEANGNITNYVKYMYSNKYSILAKITHEQGLKAAKDFLGQIKASYKNELKLEEETNRVQGNQYVYTFYHYVNDIKVLDRRVTLAVDKQTGEITNFSGLSTYNGTYGNKKPKISLDQAKETFISKIGIELVYKIRYDYETKTISSFPVYVINNGTSKAIDAQTGKVITPARENNIFYGGGLAKEEAQSMADGAERNLSPQEQKVVDEVKGLLTKEEAKSYAEKYFPRVKGTPITNASLYKSEYDNKYIWTISMRKEDIAKEENLSDQKTKLMIAAGEQVIMPPFISSDINLSVDAKTGEILSYYYYTSDQGSESEFSHDKSKEKVEAFLKNIAKDKHSLTQYDTTVTEEMPRPLSTTDPDAKLNPDKNYNYTRVANGVPVNGNGLSVTYNAAQDEVTSYSNTWNQLTFKDISQVISKTKIADIMGLELMYVALDAKTQVLAYTHTENYMTFDPFTAQRVTSHDGKPMTQAAQTLYDDIKGHAKETIIKKLYDSGIYLPGKSFKPDAVINQLDFLRLVLKISDTNVTEKDLYDRAIREGIIEKKEKNKDLIITKEKAVNYIINSTKYKEIAKISDIYAYPFKDEKEITKELKGYVTLAYGLKLIEKDKTSLFNPKVELTRADAAQMIYNLLLQEE